ncbi:hypothetical protein [Brevundimonas sp.]|uniref:hypothetical protein n=1 Tax=Brevundimonas sp. TaxID=1871086 RepID=UPI0026088398|nr:hypothetical protein [Brevundimonas sp.]
MNPTLLAMIAVVIGEAATALQAPTSAKMMTAAGSPVNAAFVRCQAGDAAKSRRTAPCRVSWFSR